LIVGIFLELFKSKTNQTTDLTQITFELYERKGATKEAREYSLRIEFSPGAHDPNLVDLELDSKHALSVAPRVFISDHIPLTDALAFLSPRNIPSLGLAQLKSVASESEDALFNELELSK
jgi:hypothetical protein